jgi:hypothetical protein
MRLPSRERQLCSLSLWKEHTPPRLALYIARFADHFQLSVCVWNLRRVPAKTLRNPVAWDSRRCDGRSNTLTVNFGHEMEHLQRLHSGGIGIAGVWSIRIELLEVGRQSEDSFFFHDEESAQHSDEETCIEG